MHYRCFGADGDNLRLNIIGGNYTSLLGLIVNGCNRDPKGLKSRLYSHSCGRSPLPEEPTAVVTSKYVWPLAFRKAGFAVQVSELLALRTQTR